MKNSRKLAPQFHLHVTSAARRFLNVVLQSTAISPSKDRERYEEDLARHEQAICENPGSALGYYGKGSALRDLMRYEEALFVYDRAISLDRTPHTQTWGYVQKGNVLRHLKRYEEALFAYDRAISLDREYSSAYLEKGHTLRSLGRHERAQDAYEHVIHLRPRDPDAYYGLSAVGGGDEAYQKAQELEGRATGLEYSPLPLLLWLLR